MMNQMLQFLWGSRSPKERIIIAITSATILAMLYGALLYSASRARPQLRSTVSSLRADAALLAQYASEIERLRLVRRSVSSQTDLRTQVKSQVDAAGLSSALVRIDSPDPGRVQIVFGAVSFPDWFNWVTVLASQSIRLETCRIEALSKPGLVSISATFVRTGG